MYLNLTHLLTLSLTILAFIALSVYTARRVKSAAAFSLGGRSAGLAIISGTITGTTIGGAATVGTAQLAYSAGLSAWWFTLGAGIGFLVMALFYAQPLRDAGLETIPEYLVLSYGKTAGLLTSIISSLGIFFSIVASTLSGIHLISSILGASVWLSAGIIAILVVIYVFFGGMQGTGLSGILKTAIIYVTLLVGGIAAYSAMGGIAGISGIFPANPWFNLFGRGIWVELGNLISLIVGIISTQTYAQAVYAARDTKTACIGTFVAALIVIPVGLPSVLIGMFMRSHHPDILPADALSIFMLNYLPSWLGGMGIAGLILSVIGSTSGLALGIGTMVSRDIVKGVFGISGDNRLLWLNRSIVLLITIGAALFSIVNIKSLVLDWNYLSMSLRGVGIFLPLTVAVFRPGSLTPGWAICSMIVSTVTALLFNRLFGVTVNPLYPGLAVSAAMVGLGAALQRMVKISNPGLR